jgi:chromosome segregation ATPase
MKMWMEFSDQYFQWWQSAANRYVEVFKQGPFPLQGIGFPLERSLEMKKMADQLTEELWRQFGLPPLAEITRLHERLNFLESRLVELQERDWAQEVSAGLLEKRDLAAREDLKPLKTAMADLEKQMVGTPELKRVQDAVGQVEAKVADLAGELATIKKAVAQLAPQLTALTQICKKLESKASAATSRPRAKK